MIRVNPGAYVVALGVLRLAPGSVGTVGWHVILGLGAVPALIGLVLRTTIPESPRWLMRQGRFDKSQETLAAFDVQVSVDIIEANARRVRHEEDRKDEPRRSAWTPGVKRALLVVCGFWVFQQITGINVPLYYGPHLLGPVFEGNNSSTVATTIAGVEVTAIMTAVNVAATYFRFRYIDRIGRHELATSGYLGMTVFALMAAAGLGVPYGHGSPGAGHDRTRLLHHFFCRGRRGHGLAHPGRGLPHCGAGPSRLPRGDRGLDGQLRPDRGIPGLEFVDRAGRAPRVLRRIASWPSSSSFGSCSRPRGSQWKSSSRTSSDEPKGPRDQGTKGPRDQGTKGPRDQGTKGLCPDVGTARTTGGCGRGLLGRCTRRSRQGRGIRPQSVAQRWPFG